MVSSIAGEPSEDATHPDYVPSKFSHTTREKSAARHSRLQKRRKLFLDTAVDESTGEHAEPAENIIPSGIQQEVDHDDCREPPTDSERVGEQCTSCSENLKSLEAAEAALKEARSRTASLEKEVESLKPRVLSADTIRDKPMYVKCFTGLMNINMVLWILSLVMDNTNFVPPKVKGLEPLNQLLLTWSRLSWGCSTETWLFDLGLPCQR